MSSPSRSVAERDRRSDLRARERQQAAVALLGQRALAGADLQSLLDEGAAAAARELSADYSKVLELCPEGDRLMMRAGVGWRPGYVGSAVVEAGTGSQAGYTLLSKEPVVLRDAASEQRFTMPALHNEHHITSGVSVIISGRDRPFGILGAYTSGLRTFSQDDIHFLQSVANVLATAIERKRSEGEREHLLSQMSQLAEASQTRAAELHGILNNMLDGVFVADPNGRLILANDAGLKMLGLTQNETLGREASQLQRLLGMRHLGGREFSKEEQPLIRALSGEAVVLEDAMVTISGDDRTRYLRMNASPIRDEDGRIVGAVTVTRDVTAIVEIEQIKDQFISVAAHELKTPVAVMKGFAQALLRTPDTMVAPRRKMLDAIDRGSDRIDRIVKDLLDISRFHAGRLELALERISLPEFLGQVVERVDLSAGDHRVLLDHQSPAVVLGDRNRLEQVLVNLIDNALKYSPQGGQVLVGVTAGGDEAVVWVSDRGVGIPPHKQERIFERFYRAHTGTAHDYGGMGVGLYISREIVERHGGRIWFESREGEGSTFSFGMPLLRGKRAD